MKPAEVQHLEAQIKAARKSPKPSTSSGARIESDAELFASIEGKLIQEAEDEMKRLEVKTARKRSSGIMISSDTDGEDAEQFSFIKWLSPKTATAVKKQLSNFKISESPAKKNLQFH